MDAPTSLYVHVPFCRSKCAYCDFYSVALDDTLVCRYLAGVARELDDQPFRLAPATVYIGGGTPTALRLKDLERLLATIRERTDCAAVTEWTVEANPAGGLVEALRVLVDAGVTRISLGVQSFDDPTLRLLGRAHNARQAREAIDAVHAAGLELSVDLIVAVPGQTPDALRRDLGILVAAAPEHASTYALSIEPGTPLAGRVERGEVTPLSDEDAAGHILACHDVLCAQGYEHYEISNFARPGKRCRHNLTYWRNEPYVGLGPAAVSYVAGRRVRNPADIDAWLQLVTTGQRSNDYECLDPAAHARETMILGMRLLEGIDSVDFRRRTGVTFEDLAGPAMASLEQEGFLSVTPERVALTRKALPVADAVLVELL